ncbi:MAG: hypothetical protein K2H30_01470 [Clostridia bacterium]|nr:hypothetical protein [Clostridia bacterium]
MQMTKEQADDIISRLQNYANSAAFYAFEKDNPVVAAQVKVLKAADLRFGDCPVFGIAQIEGDLTADGVSYTDARGRKTDIISSRLDNGYIQRYKIAGPFSSDAMLIAPSENTADDATCRIVAKRLDFNGFHHEREIAGMVQGCANSVAKQELARLDYKLQNCRVNTYRLNYTYGPMPVYIYPIFADLKDKKGKIHPTVIGTYSETNIDNGEPLDVPEIVVDVQSMIANQKLGGKTSKSAKKKRALAWTFGTLGVLAGLGIIIALLGSCFVSCFG